ncbi:MAG: PPC domain-containing DNA-binding protein [Phormidesmis sp.]
MLAKGSIETIALRLNPGADIRRDLEAIAQKEQIRAGVILSAVGSLSEVCLRFAGNDIHTTLPGKHEILTLSGMLSADGVHLHMMVANSQGECKGGHVVYGCQVYTTLELAIALLPTTQFQRVFDEATGFLELKVSSS